VIIIKFAMIAFLLFLAWMLTVAAQQHLARPGLAYYLDMAKTTSVNSIQPQYRISAVAAAKRPHALEVEFYTNRQPYRVTTFEMGVRLQSSYYYIDGYGRLRYLGSQPVWGGPIFMRQLSPPPSN
jgi:hypothetical protein